VANAFPFPLAGNFSYQALRAVSDPQLAMFRVAMMPPKSSGEAVTTMRVAFAEMWKSPQFLADYSKFIKTEPILVSGDDGQNVLTQLGKIRPEIKTFLPGATPRGLLTLHLAQHQLPRS